MPGRSGRFQCWVGLSHYATRWQCPRNKSVIHHSSNLKHCFNFIHFKARHISSLSPPGNSVNVHAQAESSSLNGLHRRYGFRLIFATHVSWPLPSSFLSHPHHQILPNHRVSRPGLQHLQISHLFLLIRVHIRPSQKYSSREAWLRGSCGSCRAYHLLGLSTSALLPCSGVS